jgi:hypothetical protein
MAITVTKKKEAKPVVEAPATEVVKIEDLSDEALADTYGKLHDEAAAAEMNPVFIQLKLVEEELLKRVNATCGPEDGVEAEGDLWIIEIGACNKLPRKVTDLKEASKLLGPKTFFELATVKVGDIEKYLTPEQAAKVLTKPEDLGYGKARKITVKYKGEPIA